MVLFFPSVGKEAIVNYQRNSLGVSLGNCLVPNCKTSFAERVLFGSVMLVVTMVQRSQSAAFSAFCRDRKKPWQPETCQDSALFTPPGNRAISFSLWGDSLRVWSTWKSEVQLSPPRGCPLKTLWSFVIFTKVIAPQHFLCKEFFCHTEQKKKKRTRPPPKENLLGSFSGLEEKLSRSVVDTKTLSKPRKPYLPPKSFLCSAHFLFGKEKSSALEQGGVCFLFPSNNFGHAGKCHGLGFWLRDLRRRQETQKLIPNKLWSVSVSVLLGIPLTVWEPPPSQ